MSLADKFPLMFMAMMAGSCLPFQAAINRVICPCVAPSVWRLLLVVRCWVGVTHF